MLGIGSIFGFWILEHAVSFDLFQSCYYSRLSSAQTRFMVLSYISVFFVTLTLQEGAHVPVQWEWQRGESIHDPTQPALP